MLGYLTRFKPTHLSINRNTALVYSGTSSTKENAYAPD